MSTAGFAFALRHTLQAEGRFSDHAWDGGGKTRYGITETVARRHGYEGEMRDLPRELAVAIYREDYWDRLRLDEVKSRPVAAKLFDIGVNQGVGWGAYCAQLGARLTAADERHEMKRLPDADWQAIDRFEQLSLGQAVDGAMGPMTLGVLNALARHYEKALLAAIAGWQFVRYTGAGIEQCRELLATAEASELRDMALRGWLPRSVALLWHCKDARPVDPDPNHAGAIA